jgi:hypothetical protein
MALMVAARVARGNAPAAVSTTNYKSLTTSVIARPNVIIFDVLHTDGTTTCRNDTAHVPTKRSAPVESHAARATQSQARTAGAVGGIDARRRLEQESAKPTVQLPDLSECLAVAGVVRWTSLHTEDSDGRAGVGLEFLPLDPESLTHVQRFASTRREPLLYELEEVPIGGPRSPSRRPAARDIIDGSTAKNQSRSHADRHAQASHSGRRVRR